jgi:predicted dehydrogenase
MIRLGVIGYGSRIHGVVHHILRPVAPEEVRVVGVVDPDEAGVRARLAECDRGDAVFHKTVDALVRKGKPDALLIGTRCNLHAPYAIQVARYDLPLYLEKPVAVTMPQALALERAFRRTRCRVVVSFPLRVSPLCVLARQYIEQGAVGEPVHAHAVNYVPYGTCYWERGYRDYAVTRGLFLQKATHDFDYLSFLMDSRIVRVAAMAVWGHVFGGKKATGLVCSRCREQETCLESPQNRTRHQTSGSRHDHLCLYSVDCGSPRTGINEDCSSALLEFESGAHAAYSQVFYARRDAAARGATVSGYLGTVSFDWYTNELKRVQHHGPFTATERMGGDASHFGGDTELAHDFLDLIRGKRLSRTPIQAGVQSVYACLAAKESARTGRFVRVRAVGE